MKKLILLLVLTLLLSGCGVFDRGNYEKDREGFVIQDGLLIKYHTNSIGEIDIFMIDKLFTYFEALDYTNIDVGALSSHPTVSNTVSPAELDGCGIERDTAIPRFLRIGEKTYYYHIRDNGNCTYDEYRFVANGYTSDLVYTVEDVTPMEPTNITRFRHADFTINTFEEIVFIEEISYNPMTSQWVKEMIGVLPMSYSQAGNNYEDIFETMEEFQVLENYVLTNQSINLLTLVDNYEDPDVNNIWSEETIEALGRDHDVVKNVRFKLAGEVLDVIQDTLRKLGMFQ